MNCSVIIVSRGRKEKLEYYLYKLYSIAKYPELVETFIRVDDDDLDTINSFTSSFCGEYKKQIRMFSGPRVGAKYLWMLYRQLFEISSGKILVPWADDNDSALKHWDEILFQYQDKIAVMGWRARLSFTRLAFDKYEEVKSIGSSIGGSGGGDYKLFKFASYHNFYYTVGKLFARVQPNDKTWREGTGGEWKFTDLSVLDNLYLKEIL